MISGVDLNAKKKKKLEPTALSTSAFGQNERKNGLWPEIKTGSQNKGRKAESQRPNSCSLRAEGLLIRNPVLLSAPGTVKTAMTGEEDEANTSDKKIW